VNAKLRKQIEKGIERLKNEEFYFYGVFGNYFKIDDMILEVLEDPNDGYRSYFGTLVHYNSSINLNHHFFDKPLGKVIFKKTENCDDLINEFNDGFEGWHLIDVDTLHEWLRFGTKDYNEYYPYFVFAYKPDKTQTKFPKLKESYVTFKERHPEVVLQYIEWFNGVLEDN